MENLDYLIKELLLEDPKLSGMIIPDDLELKRKIYRLLLTIRVPKDISEEYIEKQNEYLQSELKRKNVVDINEVCFASGINNFVILKGDITLLKVDAIVNPSDEYLLGCFDPKHHCHTGCIHVNSGIQLRCECKNKLHGMILPIGESIITDSYNLPCNRIIHTVFPTVFNKIGDIHKDLLKECIVNTLEFAKNNNVESLAFPLPDFEEFNFPLKEIIPIFLDIIGEYLNKNNCFKKVALVLDDDEELELCKNILCK